MSCKCRDRVLGHAIIKGKNKSALSDKIRPKPDGRGKRRLHSLRQSRVGEVEKCAVRRKSGGWGGAANGIPRRCGLEKAFEHTTSQTPAAKKKDQVYF